MHNFAVLVFFLLLSCCMFWRRHLQGAYAKISLKYVTVRGVVCPCSFSPSTHNTGTETNLNQERNVCKQLIGMETCTSFNHSKKNIVLLLY
jgi:hypothetical protein